jgi:hypothetical protein
MVGIVHGKLYAAEEMLANVRKDRISNAKTRLSFARSLISTMCFIALGVIQPTKADAMIDDPVVAVRQNPSLRNSGLSNAPGDENKFGSRKLAQATTTPSANPIEVGEHVKAKYHGIMGGIEWYPATIASKHTSNGTVYYTVDWADGDSRDRVKQANQIREASATPNASAIAVGDRVTAKYHGPLGGIEWYPATVASKHKSNGTIHYTVDWDDHDPRDRVKTASEIRKASGSLSTMAATTTEAHSTGHFFTSHSANTGSHSTTAGAKTGSHSSGSHSTGNNDNGSQGTANGQKSGTTTSHSAKIGSHSSGSHSKGNDDNGSQGTFDWTFLH